MRCWKCLKILGDAHLKIGFRASCLHCGQDLHVCVNCRYYALGKPNDCLVPGTESIRDREKANLCEEFKPKLDSPLPSQDSVQSPFSWEDIPKKKDFNSLFPDDPS